MLNRALPGEHSGRRDAAPREEFFAEEAVFVGRDLELRQLNNALGVASRGIGQSILISGDPGIGKTRLAWQFTLEARKRGALVLWGRCWEAGGAPPFWPWIEALRQACSSEFLPDSAVMGSHAAFVSELVPELQERWPSELGERTRPKDPDSARFLMFDAIARLLRLLADRVPVVVVVDDLQSADLASLLLSTFLTRHLHDARILLVGTLRVPTTGLSADRGAALAEVSRHSRRLSLQGLAPDDLSDLVRKMAGRIPSPSFVARIHSVTDGNPFFVDEIVRLLVAEGTLDEVEDGARALAVPHGVREAVRRRLDLVATESSALLQLAAVVGREFEVDVLALVSKSPSADVLDALEEAMQLGLLTKTSARSRLQFRHALIREVLYEDVPAAERLRLHRRVGEAFEVLDALRPGHYAAELAHHFIVAAPAGHDPRFIEHGVRAARRSLAQMAFEEAVALLERVLDSTVFAPPSEGVLCGILLALGEAQEWTHDIDGSRTTFERAAVIARRLGDAGLFVEAALGVGAVQALKFTAISRCDAAPELLREALTMIAPDDARSKARLLSRLALHHLSCSERQEALRLSADAVEASRAAVDSVALGQTLIARNAVLFGPDHLEERCLLADELHELARRTRNRDFDLRAQALTFTVRFELGDLPMSDAALDAHRELAEKSGDPFECWANLVWQGERALLEGRFVEAETYARRALERSESTSGPHTAELYGPASFVGQMILIDDDRRDGDAAHQAVEHFRVRYPELSVWRVANLLRITRAGEIEAVRNELEALTSRSLLDFDRNGGWLASMTYLSEAIELVGDRDRALLVLQQLESVRDQHVTVSHVGSRGFLTRYRGLLNATLERWDEAESDFRAAAEKHRRMRAHPHLARTLFDHARMLVRQGRLDDQPRIDRFLGEALEIASRLGMAGLAARCRMFTEHLATPAPGHTSAETPRPFLMNTHPFWTLQYGERRIVLKNAKGLTYLAALLAEPDREFSAMDLVRLLASPPYVDDLRGPGASGIVVGVEDPLVDQRARRAYERRIRELTETIEESQHTGDLEAALSCRDELHALEREMARAVGLGGRTRTSSAAERARSSVTRAIRLAIQQITAADADIGERIGRRVRTGNYCRYQSRDDRT